MKDDITIPPKALEAAAKAICKDAVDIFRPGKTACVVCKSNARAACLAMLKAWPGMKHELDWDAWLGERHTPNRIAIILPLPQEPTND